MSQLARHLLLCSQHRLKSLHATHIPGNNFCSRVSGGSTLRRSSSLESIRPGIDSSVASPESTHCQLWYGLTKAFLGADALAHTCWPRGPHKYASPPASLFAHTLCKPREDMEQLLLVAPYWPNRTWFSELTLLSSIPPWRIPLKRDLLPQVKGTNCHPCPDLWNLHLWSLKATKRTPEPFHPQWPTVRSVEPLQSVDLCAPSVSPETGSVWGTATVPTFLPRFSEVFFLLFLYYEERLQLKDPCLMTALRDVVSFMPQLRTASEWVEMLLDSSEQNDDVRGVWAPKSDP
ncbi:tRNA uridine 5-carboxymethylaminomethyl modification enzyme MnmG [Labeo rohita]|uniref:tRNA uridine 5-carboxymethylaminomethyl modification enzyme MnmG n=1 Tax=Labeo rohita TaxID=84645 RepID=A0ABQ8L6C9_LABRO|nr:tRNA uridine 5-carboxymethylaminomethyl modification enzyme MnmG [Labeo rohita]